MPGHKISPVILAGINGHPRGGGVWRMCRTEAEIMGPSRL